MMSYSLPAIKECNFFWLKTLSSNENNFSEHIGDFWSEVPVNQWKNFYLRLQLTSKFPGKPMDAGALLVSSFNWGRNSPWSFPTHRIGILQINCQMASYQSEMNCYDHKMRFIGYDSIQTRWFIFYCFQIRKTTRHQLNWGDKSHDYTMAFISYDSNQTHWFISYRFQIRTITGVTLQYPALKRFLLVSADTWYGSSTPTWTWLWCKCLAISYLPLDKAHFLRWVAGNSVKSHTKESAR